MSNDRSHAPGADRPYTVNVNLAELNMLVQVQHRSTALGDPDRSFSIPRVLTERELETLRADLSWLSDYIEAALRSRRRPPANEPEPQEEAP